MTTDKMLKKLSAKATDQTEKVDSSRPVMNLDRSKEQLMEEFAGVAAIYKIAENQKKTLGDLLKSTLWNEVLDGWMSQGSKPANPKLVTMQGNKVDCSAIFQIQARFKTEFKNEEDAIKQLTAIGMDEKKAKKFLAENVVFEDKLRVRDLYEMYEGKWLNENGKTIFVKATELEKSAAAKIIAFAMGEEAESLTDDERAAAMVTTTKILVKKEFVDNAPKYCETSADLRKLLMIVKPVEMLSHIKYAANDSFDEKSNRLRDLFESFLTSEEVFDESEDKEAA